MLRATVESQKRKDRPSEAVPTGAEAFVTKPERSNTGLALIARKIAVAQSTSGEISESGLDVHDQDGESIEAELAKQLVSAV